MKNVINIMMNFRILLSAVALSFSFGLVSAQINYVKSEAVNTQEKVFKAAPVADGTNILGYSEKEVDLYSRIGWDDADGVSYHAIKLSKDMLAPYVGQKISAIRVGLGQEISNVKVFVRETLKGNDVATGTITKGQMSWNYAKFETPYVIPADKDLYVGYSYQHVGEMYVVAVETGAYAPGACYMGFVGGGENYFDDYSSSEYGLGKLLISAIIGENVEDYGYSLTLSSSTMSTSVQKDVPFSTKVVVANTSWNPLTEATIYFREKKNPVSRSFKFEPALQSGDIVECELTDLTVSEDQEVGFNIITVNNGKKNYATQSLLYVDCKVFEGEVFDKNMLIEYYTGQMCGNCPNGTQMVYDLMKGHEDRFVWISYHSYMYDDFCNEESIFNSNKFQGGTSAPIMMLNRTNYKLYDPNGGSEIYALTMHPTYFAYTNNKQNFVDAELAEPARISVNISQSYNKDTNTLHIVVSGKRANGYLEDKNLALTVNILEDGQVAYQNGGSEDYIHNNIFRNVLSDKEGDLLTFDGEGNYSKEYDFVIPEKYVSYKSNVTTYPNRKNMKIAAFVSNKGTLLNDMHAFNVSQEKFIDDACAGIDDTFVDSSVNGLYSQDGKIFVVGEAASLEVFNMAGAEVENNSLSQGVYLVKVVDMNGNARVEKVIVK